MADNTSYLPMSLISHILNQFYVIFFTGRQSSTTFELEKEFLTLVKE